ncbi:MAG TPA: PAS domain S-box protein [Gemmatimonadaceae bacterium]|nr:PAS domain S-box protein [Gemmatimonadaceae bacterium]
MVRGDGVQRRARNGAFGVSRRRFSSSIQYAHLCTLVVHRSPFMTDDARTQALRRTDLLDAPLSPEFDRLTRLIARTLRAPMALVSLVDSDRQFFAASTGLSEPWRSRRETPLSHSICKHVVELGTTLAIEDTRQHPLVRDTLAVHELGVVAYAGSPLRGADGLVLGAVCALDVVPRAWSADELLALEDLAVLAGKEIDDRRSAFEQGEGRDAMQDLVENATHIIVSATPDGRIIFANAAWRTIFGYTEEETRALRPIDVVAPEDRGRYVETAKRMIAGETVTNFEAVLIAKDGRRVAVRGGGSCRFRDGVPVATRTIFRDITEEKRAETELRLLQRVTHAISEAADLRAAYIVTLRELCQVGGWPYGEVWLPSADGDALVHGPVWHEPDYRLAQFARGREEFRFAQGTGLPGRAWAMKRPVWISDIESDAALGSRQLAQVAGVRAGVAVPVRADDEVVAILTFCSAEPRAEDPHGLELLATVAAQVGAVVRRRRAEAALREAGRRFREILETTRFAAVTLDADARITFANDAVLTVTGWKRGEVIGRDWFELFTEPSPASLAHRKALRQGALPRHFEQEIVTRDGKRRLVVWDNTPLRDTAGRCCGVACIGEDVTERRAAADAQARLTAILELTPDVVGIATLDGNVEYLNRAGRSLLGIADGESARLSTGDLQPQFAQGGALEHAMRRAIRDGVWRGETYIRKRDGREIPVEQIIISHRSASGEVEYVSTIIRDIIERKQTEATLRGLALVDELTGLYNRRGFATLAEQEWKRARREGWPLLVLYMDLDEFKGINDTFGHAEGDLTLKAVAGILRATFREADVIGRPGGDEFTVLAIHGDEGTEATVRARLEQKLAEYNATSGRPYAIGLSIGVARSSPTSDQSLSDLLASADAALYEAKRSRPHARARAS